MNSRQTYGLIGFPVKHSLSPLMHNAAFKKLGIAAEYKLFEVKPQDLEKFLLKDVFEKNISGFNITIPHKVKAYEILEKEFPFDKDAHPMQQALYYVTLSGAINTARKDGLKLLYWNTDASGFLRSLSEDLKFELKNQKVLLFGCGGAGRAAISGLSWKNYGAKKIYIYDPNKAAIDSARRHFLEAPKEFSLEESLEFIPYGKIAEVIKECSLLINASGIGMKEDDPEIIDKKLIHEKLLVYDLIYNPKETKLLNQAKMQGARVYNGLGMLLYQGVDAFELWTGEKAPVDIMRDALNEGVNKL